MIKPEAEKDEEIDIFYVGDHLAKAWSWPIVEARICQGFSWDYLRNIVTSGGIVRVRQATDAELASIVRRVEMEKE